MHGIKPGFRLKTLGSLSISNFAINCVIWESCHYCVIWSCFFICQRELNMNVRLSQNYYKIIDKNMFERLKRNVLIYQSINSPQSELLVLVLFEGGKVGGISGIAEMPLQSINKYS